MGHSPRFELGLKAPFCILLRVFNKNILKQQNAENHTEIDFLELLKLQNVLRPQTWLGQS